MNELDKLDMEIACPTCGKKIKKTVGWLKKDGRVCPHGCGTTFDTNQFKRDIKKAEDELTKLKRSISNMKFKL